MDKDKEEMIEKAKPNAKLKVFIIILSFLLIVAIGVIIYLLNHEHKCQNISNCNNDNNRPQEEIKSFGESLNEFTMNNERKKEVKVNDYIILIENREDGVYLNNRKINFMYTSGGYVLDKFLILYTSPKEAGKKLIFLDYNLKEFAIDDKDLLYSDLSLENGILTSKVSKYDSHNSCKIFGTIEVCECNQDGESFMKYKDSLIGYYDEIIQGEIKLTYHNQKIDFEYTSKVTFKDYYESDINGETNKYCVKEM